MRLTLKRNPKGLYDLLDERTLEGIYDLTIDEVSALQSDCEAEMVNYDCDEDFDPSSEMDRIINNINKLTEVINHDR